VHRTPGVPGRWPLLACALTLAASVSTTPASGTVSYPLAASADGRYLVDQAGSPFLMIGDAPHSLVVNLTEPQAGDYLADRAALGFNSLWVELLCTTYTGGRADGSQIDGTLPFTATLPGTASYDLTTPNDAYFRHVDRLLAMAASRGIMVLLDPIDTGGYIGTLLDNGTARCRAFGQYLGTRYVNTPNLLWLNGNDFQGWRDPARDDVVRAVALGIRDRDTRHLQTVELDFPLSSSLDDATWSTVLGLNATYTYFPTYAQLWRDYGRSPFLPSFLVEGNYEFEGLMGPVTTAPILRKQGWWAMTSGAIGQVYGNGYVWPFLFGWQSHLDTPGALQLAHITTFFAPRAWYQLVPDTAHTVVTAGYGTYSSTAYVANNDMLTAARTPDGSLVVAYTPIARTFTVDMSRLAAAATARWFDPSSGAYASVTGSPFANSGARAFTTPGPNRDGDGAWALVLETQPVETQPPTTAVTAPAPGASLSGLATVSASVSDAGTGVAGVRFQMDGVDLAPELAAPPFTIAWDTRTAPNGAHVVRALSRDVAGNRGADSVSVTLANTTAPPPRDHLAAAWGFDATAGTGTADASGNGNTITLHGATFATGRHGDAIVLAAGKYAEAANSPSLDIGGSGLTLAFWARVDTTAGAADAVLITKPWSAGAMLPPYHQYGVEYTKTGGHSLRFHFADDAARVHGPYVVKPPMNTWTHIAFTYDGTAVKGYVDGVLRLSMLDAGRLQSRGNPLRLGLDAAGQQPFTGSLDDLRVYSRALAADEIQAVRVATVGNDTVSGPGPDALPARAELAAAWPNPFRDVVTLTVALPRATRARILVFDAAGRLVRRLHDGPWPAGRAPLTWDGRDDDGRHAAAGRYFIELRADGETATAPVVRLR
jgi:hypothetical protein